MQKWCWVLLLAVGCQSPEKMYESEKLHLKKQVELATESRFDSVTLASLPPTLQRYIVAAGYFNAPVQMQAEVNWEQCWLKIGLGREWGEMDMQQFNSVRPLGRLAYMEFKDMPMSGRDKYYDGVGEMKGKLFGRIPVVSGTGGAVSQSALITAFAEFVLVPAYLLQPYVQWEEITLGQVRGTLKHDRFTVVGDFYFDDNGLFKRFESQDRYYDLGKGKYAKMPFYVYADGWQEKDGRQLPRTIRALWQLPDEGAFEYFRGRLAGIDYLP
ncbi:MAG: DUF6544 family protein [Bacteroidia bacterium]